MEQKYAVTVCGKQVGIVSVKRQGLYYHFSCRCCLEGNVIYRLVITVGHSSLNLGIPVPEGGSFTLNTKLPVKCIGEGDMSFTLVPKHEPFSGTFIPISPEEPFAYISRLRNAFLVLRNEQVGICIDKQEGC